MKTLLFSLLLVFGGMSKSEANYFSVHCQPCPVAAFNGSASQTSPFSNWSLNTCTNYAYYYYYCCYSGAYYRYWGYYGNYYYCYAGRTRTWIVNCMTCYWQND